MRANNGTTRWLHLFTLAVGIAFGVAASSAAGASTARDAVAQAQPQAAACVAPAADAPIRVWRNGRFAGA